MLRYRLPGVSSLTANAPFDELLRLENQLIEYRTKTVLTQTIILTQRAVIDRYLIN